MRALITGATGNVGRAVIDYCNSQFKQLRLVAAVRKIQNAQATFEQDQHLDYRYFDFTDPASYSTATKNVDILFLLRPPQISKGDTYFRPLLEAARANGVKKVLFISVQGAELSRYIPHNKIESLIKLFNFDYCFIRPSYFMQNLTGYLLNDINQNNKIVLPSGNAEFNWVDVQDIAEASAVVMADFDKHVNSVYTITGSQNLNFDQVAEMLSQVLDRRIIYKSIDPIRFFLRKKKEGLSSSYIVVLILLHFLPRFQPPPQISDDFFILTGRKPRSLEEFLKKHRKIFSA
jgi:uncharacterized protein YbjT (DUF2867 family)